MCLSEQVDRLYKLRHRLIEISYATTPQHILDLDESVHVIFTLWFSSLDLASEYPYASCFSCGALANNRGGSIMEVLRLS